MCSETNNAIQVAGISKHYEIYEHPRDRLKQFVAPRLQRLLKRPVRQYYREFDALRDISFSVKRGETVGIIGRNGSGKSTLLQIICGTLAPSTGEVQVNGRIAALLELGSGFNPEFSGRENVFLNGAILGLDRQQMEARFDEIAAFADIGDFLDQPVKNYSSGMQVRLAFAVSVCVEPDILVVDEALAVGDEAFQRKCFARIERIKEDGGTILFVNHGAQAVIQLSDRAILLDRGELLCAGRPKFVVNQYQRLLNVSPAEQDNLRAQILAFTQQEQRLEQVPADNPAGMQELTVPQDNTAVPDEGYDPSLSADAVTRLEERGARIQNVKITTLRGTQVNLLQMGKRYRLEYEVEFDQPAQQVGMGFGMRTISGLMVAGASMFLSRKHRIANVSSAQRKHVSFEFTCNLLPDTYFVQCGVRGTVAGEDRYLNRVFDVICFRVLPEEESILTGYFDMNVLPAHEDI
ncbi:ABC transporter ATP-binding protein [Halopseudomonas sp. Lyrl_26]|uniref:ABC transporter ATP-binding protein n=1 Tax=Halopseudomonas sp. Lyrl_26 TaxID=3110923 RepID=UPI003F812DCB